MSNNFDLPDEIWRKKVVKKFTGLSDTTLWRLEKGGVFPQRRHLSPRCVGWLKSEVLEWMRTREEAGRKPHQEENDGG